MPNLSRDQHLDPEGLTLFSEEIKANFFRNNQNSELLDMDDIVTPGIYAGSFVATSCPYYHHSYSTENYHLIVTRFYSSLTGADAISQIAIYELEWLHGVSLIYHRHSFGTVQEHTSVLRWGDWHRILTQQDLDDLFSNVMSSEYSSSATYDIGDYCTYDNKIYRCTTAITSEETWNAAHWTSVLLTDEIKSKGTVNSVKIGNTEYTPTSGVVTLPNASIMIDGTTVAFKNDSAQLNFISGDNVEITPKSATTSRISVSVNAKSRPIQLNGTEILGNNTTPLNLVEGSGVSLSNSGGSVTISSYGPDTTYTFANGINGFTVTPSDGSAQTVTVTPSITNNITGSGTSGYLTKFNGANTITNGPQLGSSTTTYLRNDGSWQTPTDTNTIAGMTDVQLTSPTDNDLLVYDSSLTGGKLWKNAKKIVTCTKAQFDNWSANNTFPYTDCKYIVTDAPNTNGTSEDLSYDGGVTSTHDVIAGIIADYGFEEYSSGVWTWRKWNNGTLELWGNSDEIYTGTFNSWGNVFSLDVSGLGSYPIPFVRIDTITGSCALGGANASSTLTNFNLDNLLSAPGYIMIRGTNIGSDNRKLVKNLYVKGKWK